MAMPRLPEKQPEMSVTPENTLPFAGNLATAGKDPLGLELDWLQDIRQSGVVRYRDLGLPAINLEDWKYTNLLALGDMDYLTATPDHGDVPVDVVPSIFPTGNNDLPSGARLVFVNGMARADLSTMKDLPAGVTLEPLAQVIDQNPGLLKVHLGQLAIDTDRAMLALNNAAMNSGYVLHVAKGVVMENPIEIIHIGGIAQQPLACFPRNLVIMEENSQADMIVHHVGVGGASYFVNTVNEISLGQAARLRVYNVQDESHQAINITANWANVTRDASYSSFNLSLGARLSRFETYVALNGTGAMCKLDGAYLMRGQGHCDNTLRIDHLKPDTTSSVMFKGVLDDRSRAVFQGKIVVHRDAQRSDGQMHNKTMLLSDKAEIDTKPELEIYADDVKCAHGAASGHVDETALFYMRSRGIPDDLARNLLIQSFLAEVLERVNVDTIGAAMNDKVTHWLPVARGQI